MDRAGRHRRHRFTGQHPGSVHRHRHRLPGIPVAQLPHLTGSPSHSEAITVSATRSSHPQHTAQHYQHQQHSPPSHSCLTDMSRHAHMIPRTSGRKARAPEASALKRQSTQLCSLHDEQSRSTNPKTPAHSLDELSGPLPVRAISPPATGTSTPIPPGLSNVRARPLGNMCARSATGSDLTTSCSLTVTVSRVSGDWSRVESVRCCQRRSIRSIKQELLPHWLPR